MTSLNLDALLKPESIAIVGASDKPGAGRQVIENLENLGYAGEILPVNPKYEEVANRRCFSSLSDLAARREEEVDLVAILLGNKLVLPILKEAKAAGARAAWAFASGFAESGKEGEELQAQITEFCNENGIAFHGPNCVGLINTINRAGAYSAPLSPGLKEGNIGAIAQSGSLSMAMANSALDVGFSYIISSGNEAQLDSTDYISYMIDDDNTDVIVGFIEQFRDPEKLRKVAKKAEDKNIPIIVLKVGKSEIAQEATRAHTAAVAGSDKAHDAFFRKRGIVRVEDMDQLLQTAKLFAQMKTRPPRGNRAGVLTLSGGEIGLIADLNRNTEINFPEWSATTRETLRDALPEFITPKNPLDAWGSGDLEETYPLCMEAASRDPSMDIIVVSLNAAGNLAKAQVDQFKIAAKAAARAQRETDKPVVAVSNISSQLDDSIKEILEEAGVPFLKGTREGFTALESFISYGEFIRTKTETSPDRGRITTSRSRTKKIIEGNRDGLTEYEGKRILTAYGIPTTKEFLVDTAGEAREKANRIGYPVALKVLSPDIQHKTEAGALSLNIQNDDELTSSYEELLKNAKAYKAGANIRGILVQEMVTEESVEVIVGFTDDRNFGPVITFGLGGIFVELLEDVSLRLPPISEEMAREMIKETTGSKLLEGFRGGINGDLESLINAILRVSLLAEDFNGKISALDINPLLVMEKGNGVIAADALVDLS